MKIEKLDLSKEKADINLKFYFFLKHINKLNPSNNQLNLILENINLLKSNIEFLLEKFDEIFAKSQFKIDNIKEIGLKINNQDDIDLFDFSVRIYQIKNLLLAEAKIFETIDLNILSDLHPLSMEYEKISLLKPYKKRVSGALLSLLFFEKIDNSEFNFMSKDSLNYISDLSKKAKKFKKMA